MQNLNCDLRALGTAELLAQQPMKSSVVLLSSAHHRTRGETPKDSGGMARYILLSNPKASHALIQGRGRPGRVLWAPGSSGSLNLGHSREALCLPGAASSQDHREARLQGAPCCREKPDTHILPPRWNGGLQKDCPSRPSASASLQMCLHELPLQQEWEKMASDGGYFGNCPPVTSTSLQLDLQYSHLPAHFSIGSSNF